LAMWPRSVERPPAAPAMPEILTGSAADLAPAIQRSRRAVVYVGAPTAVQGVVGLRRFRDAVRDLPPGPVAGASYFVIEDESADDTRAWGEAFRDDRLASFGVEGCGWVFWLEFGRLRAVESCTGCVEGSGRNVADRTRAVWP
jgi:hypothetical protein